MKRIILYNILFWLSLSPVCANDYITGDEDFHLQSESFSLGSDFLDLGDQMLNETDYGDYEDWEEMIIFDEDGNPINLANPDNVRNSLGDGVWILLSLTAAYGIYLRKRRKTTQ